MRKSYAAYHGHVECLKELIAARADINRQDDEGRTPLINAAYHGHVECLKELIAARADINRKDNEGQTALIVTADQRHVECLKEIIAAGADINQQDTNGDSALMRAVHQGNNAIVRLLTEAGCDINSENNEGETALYLAVQRGHLEAERPWPEDEQNFISSAHVANVYTLLKAGAHLNATSTGLSPVTAHLNPTKLARPNSYILKILSVAGAEIIETKTLISYYVDCLQNLARDKIRKHVKQIHPETNLYFTISKLYLPYLLQSFLLFYTLAQHNYILQEDEKEFLSNTAKGNVDSVSSLIEAGVDVNVQDENGITALMKASEGGHTELVEELIKAEADKNIQDLHGDTSLIHAVEAGKLDCVEKLVKFGVNANRRGRHGETALLIAVISQFDDCVETLINFGVNVNIPDDSGITALMYASNDLRQTNNLIQSGAVVNTATKGGFTALNFSITDGNVECLKRLVEAGADVNCDKDEIIIKPLIEAASEGQVKCLEELIKAGVDLNIGSEFNELALSVATGKSFFNCVSTLLKAGAEVDLDFLARIARELLEAGNKHN